MSAASDASYGQIGAVQQQQQNQQQQSNSDAMLYMHNGVACNNSPVPAAYQAPAGGDAAVPVSAKRRPGRPRKNVHAPAPLAIILTPSTATAAGAHGSSGPGTLTLPPGFGPNTEDGAMASHQAPPPPASQASPTKNKKKGRPPGATKSKMKLKAPPKPQPQTQKQMAAPVGSGLIGVNPHMLIVQAGQDVRSRVMSFSCNGWAVCVVSANGTISNVTLRQGYSSGGTVTYEGRFEILSLAGSYLLSECGGLSSRTGSLTVSLVGRDGRVLAGSVAGPLIAASPVQVVIGNFSSDGKKETDLSLAPGRVVYPLASSSSPSSGGL